MQGYPKDSTWYVDLVHADMTDRLSPQFRDAKERILTTQEGSGYRSDTLALRVVHLESYGSSTAPYCKPCYRKLMISSCTLQCLVGKVKSIWDNKGSCG